VAKAYGATGEAGHRRWRERDPEAGGSVNDGFSLEAAAQLVLDECRTVLPGLQALFGFQLIAVFNSGFGEKLAPFEQRLHLVAIALVVLAAAMLMTPAAYHSQVGARRLTWDFVQLAMRLLVCSLPPLALATALEMYLIGRIILGPGAAAVAIAASLLGVFVALWFVMPRLWRLRRATAT
jgi:hypothetical protein